MMFYRFMEQQIKFFEMGWKFFPNICYLTLRVVWVDFVAVYLVL